MVSQHRARWRKRLLRSTAAMATLLICTPHALQLAIAAEAPQPTPIPEEDALFFELLGAASPCRSLLGMPRR